MSDQVSGDTGRTERDELADIRATVESDEDSAKMLTGYGRASLRTLLREIDRLRALAPEPSGVPPERYGRLVEAHLLVGKVGATELRNGMVTTGYEFTPDELDDFITLVLGGVSGATTEVERVARRAIGLYAELIRQGVEPGKALEESAASTVARLSAIPKEEAR